MNNFNNFYQTVEKKYLPNGQKDIFVGTKSLFNILDKEVDMQTCEAIFLKAVAVLALNSEAFSLEKLKEHLTASGSEMYFSETQALHFHKLLQAVRRLAHDGKGLSQVVEINQTENKPNILKSYVVGVSIFVCFLLLGLVISNLLTYYGTLASKSGVFIWLGFIVIPIVWLLNNVVYGLLSAFAKANGVSSKAQFLLGILSVLIALNAVYFTITTYEFFSVRNIMNLLASGFAIHASTIFIKQRNSQTESK